MKRFATSMKGVSELAIETLHLRAVSKAADALGTCAKPWPWRTLLERSYHRHERDVLDSCKCEPANVKARHKVGGSTA